MIPMVEQVPGYKSLRLEPYVRSLAADVIGDVGRVLWILLGVVGIVLLIACANVANLFLVRAEGRQQELAVRSALGASRSRIARELLTESLMLGLAGGLVGVAFARAGIGLLRKLAPTTLPRLDEIAIDPVVLLFALGVSLFTGLLFGVIPVLRLGTPHSSTALRESARGTSASPMRQRTRNALVVAEVAMALVLLILSGLMIRTFLAMRDVHPGFVRASSACSRLPAWKRSDSRRPSRWTARTTRIPLSSRTFLRRKARCRRCGDSRASLPAISKPWAIRSRPDAPSRGRTSTSSGESS
jgi:predicted lysophospholipase L1 biosynthesis ABC-type transport system permease subunit